MKANSGFFSQKLWGIVLLTAASLTIVACGETDISDAEHLQRAKQYQADGDLRASLIELKSALQKNTANSEARLLLGELYVLAGEGAAAEKELSRARELGVSGLFVQKLLGESLLLQHRFNDVLSMLEGLGRASQPELLVLRGQAQLGLGQRQEAEISFRQALALKADTVSALLWLSRVLLAANDIEEVSETLQKVLDIHPENVEAWVLKGRLASSQERFDDAQTDFYRAIDLLSASAPRRIEMEARTELAKLLIGQQQFADAEAQVSYLLEAAPRHPITNYMAALLAFEQGQFTKARDYLLVVLKVSPDHLQSLFLLGSTNYALGNLEQAEVQLVRVVAAAPALLPARMMLAAIRLQQAQSDQALDILEPALAQVTNNVRLLAMAGQAALRSGELEKGRRLLQKAITEQPGEGSLRTQLAMLYLAEGNDAQAVKELEQAIEAGNVSLREQSLLVLTHLRRKDFDDALAVAERLMADNPQNAYLQNLLGVIYVAKGDVHMARAAFNKSLNIDASFVTATLNLVRLDILAGRQSDARERLDSILVRDEGNVSAMMALAQLADLENDRLQALRWLEKARSTDRKALAPRMVLTRIYMRTGQLARAREVMREALVIEPYSPRVLLIAGQVELTAENFKAAVQNFEQLVKSTPVAASYFWLGFAHLRANEEDKARQSLDRALRIDPNHLGAMDLLVLLDLRAGKIMQAQQRVDTIKRWHPNSVVGYEREGDIQARLKEDAKAIKAYRKARLLGGGARVLVKEVHVLRRSEGNQAVKELLEAWLKQHEDDTRARFSLAATHILDGNNQAAISQYRHLLEIEPKNVAALNDIAWLLHKEGRLAEALVFAERAHKLMPENGMVLDTYGWIVFSNGQTDTAVDILRQAAEKQPDAKEVQYHYAAALIKSGKRDKEVQQMLERVLLAGEDFEGRLEARKLLDSLKSE